MSIAAGIIIVLMLVFASITAFREIKLYRKALAGKVQYLVSKSRLARRLTVSGLLFVESIFFVIGFYVLNLSDPLQSLLFWMPALILILLVVYLGMKDFRETRRDIDKILLEAAHSAVRKKKEGNMKTQGSRGAEEQGS
jgi:membrane protein required for beta-lactamase induction